MPTNFGITISMSIQFQSHKKIQFTVHMMDDLCMYQWTRVVLCQHNLVHNAAQGKQD